MIRDPFDIHRKDIFKATASRAAQNIRETASRVGANALDMSFNIPRNVPNFADSSRDLEDHAWASIRGTGAKVQSRVNGLFDQESLPMYKDKPYSHMPSYKNRPLWRKKRFLGTVALGIVFVLYLCGLLPGSGSKSRSSKSAWPWASLADNVDWDERRQRVVEAFEVSWDAYEQYAWGRLAVDCPPPSWVTMADLSVQAMTSSTRSRRRARTWHPRALGGSSSTPWTP